MVLFDQSVDNCVDKEKITKSERKIGKRYKPGFAAGSINRKCFQKGLGNFRFRKRIKAFEFILENSIDEYIEACLKVAINPCLHKLFYSF